MGKKDFEGIYVFHDRKVNSPSRKWKGGGRCGGLRFWEICEDKRKKNERVACGRSVVGFGGEDRLVLEGTVNEHCLVVGLDLVQLQILIPILPLRVSLSPLPPVFYERRICATPNKRNKATTEPAVQPGCGLRVAIPLLPQPRLSSSPSSLCRCSKEFTPRRDELNWKTFIQNQSLLWAAREPVALLSSMLLLRTKSRHRWWKFHSFRFLLSEKYFLLLLLRIWKRSTSEMMLLRWWSKLECKMRLYFTRL